MRRTRCPLAALAVIALIGLAGCSNAPGATGSDSSGGSTTAAATTTTGNNGGSTTATNREQAMQFAACMRANGVSAFPDPDPSGAFTIDAIVNGSSLDPSSASWLTAIGACKDLEPAGFMGHKRSAKQQQAALKFAQCMRDNGVADFPDPSPDGPIINVDGAHLIPGFQAALEKCSSSYATQLGLRGR